MQHRSCPRRFYRSIKTTKIVRFRFFLALLSHADTHPELVLVRTRRSLLDCAIGNDTAPQRVSTISATRFTGLRKMTGYDKPLARLLFVDQEHPPLAAAALARLPRELADCLAPGKWEELGRQAAAGLMRAHRRGGRPVDRYTELYRAVDLEFGANGVVIAFPERDLHFYPREDRVPSVVGDEDGVNDRVRVPPRSREYCRSKRRLMP